MSRVAIVGTAGRGRDAHKVSYDLFVKMQECALDIINHQWQMLDKVTLISGGAAVADHVAVALFLKFPQRFQLELYLPCPLDSKASMSTSTSPEAYAMKQYHQAFTRDMAGKLDSLQQLRDAKALGAAIEDGKYQGFHQRNTAVAQRATHLIAFTWGTSSQVPKAGGTLDTWNKCAKTVRKIHVPLSNLCHQ